MSNLYYRSEKYVRDTFVEYLRRCFKYGGSWRNRELEIVSVDKPEGELVFEQFFEEPEKYPLITVGSQGGTSVLMGFNSQVDNMYDFTSELGSRSLSLVDFSTTTPFAFKLPTDFTGSLGGFVADMMWKDGSNVDDITIKLFENYFTTGSVLIASGSIRNFDSLKLQTYFGSFYPYPAIQDKKEYWIELTPQSGSVYRIATDPTYNGVYSSVIYSGNIPSGSLTSGSIYGGLRYSPVLRMGGANEFSVIIRCSAKNSMEKAQNLVDLSEIYIKMGQHGIFNRQSTNVTKIDLSRLMVNGVSFLTSRGISVKNISKGAIENRKRGDNDIIFTIGLTVECRSEWNLDFNEQVVKEIQTEVTTYP